MSSKIHRRPDVNPARGEHEYGNVTFADPVNKKYPIDSPEHIRGAWSYFNRPANAEKYLVNEITSIKRRIKAAARKHGIEITHR
jgi:hypothetical protein